jgi:bifunctional non-homologous end joining protein LigD
MSVIQAREGDAPPTGTSRVVDIDGHRLVLTELEGPAWVDAAASKAELLTYYLDVADEMLPFLRGRPSSVVRRVDDGLQQWVFDRSAGSGVPSWISRCQVRPEFSVGPVEAVAIDNRAALAHLVNAGCLAFHPWSATCQVPDRPDQMLFDVDPTEIAFREVRNAALLIRDLLARQRIRAWVKTSGGRGLHVMVPLRPMHSFDEVRAAAEFIARAARAREPKLFTFEKRRSRRRGRILVDVERNRSGSSLVSPFSVKPESGLVSTPLAWPELERAIYPEDFPLPTVSARAVQLGLPLRDFFEEPQSLEGLLQGVEARARRRA